MLDGTPYRVHGVIAEGGMAVLLDAEDQRDHRRLALKMLRPEAASEGDLVARLRTEGNVLVELYHPNLVEVRDSGVTASGRPYVAMERLVGRDLRAELSQRRALSRDLALEIARQALAGLEMLHGRGIVHRDIKPANLFLCEHPDGGRVVKLLDLGIARITEGARIEALSSRLKTAPGEVLGTPAYLAPELLHGRSATPAADVYAMGIVLYEMLTGSHPFAGKTLAQMWQAHLHEMPRAPSALAVDVLPAALDRVVMRALSKEPRDRFADATEMAAALARAASALAEPGGGASHTTAVEPSTVPPTAPSTAPPTPSTKHPERQVSTSPHREPVATVTIPAKEPTVRAPAIAAATLASPTWVREPPQPGASTDHGTVAGIDGSSVPRGGAGRTLLMVCIVAAASGAVWHALATLRGIAGVLDPSSVYGDAFGAAERVELVRRVLSIELGRDVCLAGLAVGMTAVAARRLRGRGTRGPSWWLAGAVLVGIACGLDVLATSPRISLVISLGMPPAGSEDLAHAVAYAVAFVTASLHSLLLIAIFGAPTGRR